MKGMVPNTLSIFIGLFLASVNAGAVAAQCCTRERRGVQRLEGRLHVVQPVRQAHEPDLDTGTYVQQMIGYEAEHELESGWSLTQNARFVA